MKEQGKRVLVFGGSFNPPHNGHQMIVKEVLTRELDGELITDQLWFLPVGLHDFGKACVSAQHRLEMSGFLLEALIEENSSLSNKIKVEKSEIVNAGVSYTANTLRYLSSTYPQYQFSFLIGSDNLEKFHLWYDKQGKGYKDLLKEFNFYVYPRTGYAFDPIYEKMISLDGFPELKVSSTGVRKAFENRTSLKPLLNVKVISYIKENNLYR